MKTASFVEIIGDRMKMVE